MSGFRQRVSASLRPVADDRPLVEEAPGMTVRQVLRRYWPRLRPMRWWLLLSGVFIVAGPLIGVAEIKLFEILVDEVLVPADWRPLVWLTAVFVGLNIVSAIVSGLDDYLTTWISQTFLLDLRVDVFRHLLSLPLHVHQRRRLGDMMSRITSDVSAVETFMVGHLAGGAESAIRLLIYGGALVWMDWQLALASFIVIPLFWWISAVFATYVRRLSRERRRRSGSLSSITEEQLSNGPLVQAYNREDDAADAYQRQNTAIFGAEMASSRVRALFLPLVDLTELLGTLTVIGMGVWALHTDRMTLGALLAFLTLLAQCYSPIRELSDLLPDMYSATAGIERLTELLDEKPPVDEPGAVALSAPRGDIRFERVTARYPGANRPAVQDLSLELRPGEVVALSGPSGVGKSTVTRLITRHLDAEAGTVLFDGRPVQQWTIESVRDAVTVVLQETLMLDTTVAENIAFARPDATREEVVVAAEAADADEFIRALPDGYESRIGQRGRNLSGGQRQRLALARALLRDTPVLILDEPTAGLDPTSAERVLEPLRRVAGDKAVLLITHDPLALAHVDRTVTMTQPPGGGLDPEDLVQESDPAEEGDDHVLAP